jgi:alpha-methylacyl-CoA racemase
MMLGDMGANVVRIDRPGARSLFPGPASYDLLNRSKRSIALDLKQAEDRDAARQLIAKADIVLEGFRPGVAERLGLGPEECLQLRPELVYGRMSGWGRSGPWAQRAGHDVSYIAVTGALHAIGPGSGPPAIPLALVGDCGGGGMYLVAGVLAALSHARLTGSGQVVDAAIVDGVSHLLSATHAMLAAGAWVDERESNLLDGGVPYYDVYETSDGKFMAVGAIENAFYAELLVVLGVDEPASAQNDRDRWPTTRERIAAAFRSKTRREWTEAFEGTDACVAPVLGLTEAADHPQLAARGTFVEQDGVLQAAPAPRFSETPTSLSTAPPEPGANTHDIAAEFGINWTTRC